MKIKNFVIYMILIFAFVLTPNVAFAKCSTIEGNSTSGCQNFHSTYSDCMSLSSAFSIGIDQAISNEGLNYSVGDYSHKLITRKYVYDTSYFFKNSYNIYFSKQPLVLNDGKVECSEEFLVFSVSEFALHEQYPLSKKCCNGKAFTSFTGRVSSYSFSGDIISSNYDLCDTNGNVVQGTLLSEGYIEITLPNHNDDNIFTQLGLNVLVLKCRYEKTNFFNSPPYIDISGLEADEYEISDTEFDCSDETGKLWGSITYVLTLPYNVPKEVCVSFYDDLNNYYEDKLTITCYENRSGVPDDVDIDESYIEHGGTGGSYDTDTGTGTEHGGIGGSYDTGTESSSTNAIFQFFENASRFFEYSEDFFLNFAAFISSTFTYLPPEFTFLLSGGLVIVILLRIFGR